MLSLGINADTGEEISLPYKQRTQGVSIIGQTGYGKTTLLTHMIADDVREGRTAVVLDPHGDLCKTIINTTPKRFEQNLVFLEVNPEFPFGLNLFACENPKDPIQLDRTVDGVMQIIRKMMGSEQVYLRTDRVIRAIAYTLVENQGYTLAHVRPLLRDKVFRDGLIKNVTNPEIRGFWEEYDESYGNLMIRRDFVEPVMNRVGMFLERSFLYRVMSQEKTTIDFASLLNSRKIYLISIPIGVLGAGITELLGTIFLFELSKAIYARAEQEKRPRVHLYIDEFQRFTLSNITASLLKEGRKFGLGTTIALQVLSDLKDEENRNAVLQTGTLLCFQTIGADAEELARNFDCTPPPPIMEKRTEPVLIISQHPIRDLTRLGHTHPDVNKFIQNVLYLAEETERHRREYYSYVNSDTVWLAFRDYDMEGFRNHHEEITEALKKLDEYFIAAMEERVEIERFTESDLVLDSYLYGWLGGVCGVRPWYRKRLNPEYAHYLEQQLLPRSRFDLKDKELDPRLLERAEEWVRVPVFDGEDTALEILLYQFLNDPIKQDQMQEARKLMTGVFSVAFKLVSGIGDRSVTFSDEFGDLLVKRVHMQLSNFWGLVIGAKYTAVLLAKEPLMVPSGRYIEKEVIMQQRTFADKQNEIASILATLPPYTLFCQLTTDNDIQQMQVKLLPPDSYPKPHADEQAVKAVGRSLFGREWQGYDIHIPTKTQLVKEPEAVKPVKSEPVNQALQEPPPRKTWEEEE